MPSTTNLTSSTYKKTPSPDLCQGDHTRNQHTPPPLLAEGAGFHQASNVRYQPMAINTGASTTATKDVIKGLTKCTHADFSKLFADFAMACKNNLLTAMALTDNAIKQIKTVLSKADLHYISYHLANEWTMPGGSAHYGERPVNSNQGKWF